MEQLRVLLNEPKRYDKAVHGGLPEGRDTVVITKDGAMVSGAPGAVIAFTVQLPNGEKELAQTTLSVRNLIALGRLLSGRYPELDA